MSARKAKTKVVARGPLPLARARLLLTTAMLATERLRDHEAEHSCTEPGAEIAVGAVVAEAILALKDHKGAVNYHALLNRALGLRSHELRAALLRAVDTLLAFDLRWAPNDEPVPF